MSAVPAQSLRVMRAERHKEEARALMNPLFGIPGGSIVTARVPVNTILGFLVAWDPLQSSFFLAIPGTVGF